MIEEAKPLTKEEEAHLRTTLTDPIWSNADRGWKEDYARLFATLDEVRRQRDTASAVAAADSALREESRKAMVRTAAERDEVKAQLDAARNEFLKFIGDEGEEYPVDECIRRLRAHRDGIIDSLTEVMIARDALEAALQEMNTFIESAELDDEIVLGRVNKMIRAALSPGSAPTATARAAVSQAAAAERTSRPPGRR